MNVSLVLTSEDGAAYVPFARAKLRYFQSVWNGGHVSHKIKNSDVLISFELWSKNDGRITITTTGYMESGILDLQHSWRGNELTYKPAKIRLTNFVKSTGLPNAGSRKVTDMDDSWTMAGCKEGDKIEKFSIQMGSDEANIRNFSSKPAEFCEPDQIEKGKQLFIGVPSSLYTGKLKLYVQALFGSQRTDFKLDPGVFGRVKVSTGEFTKETAFSEPQEIFFTLMNQMPTSGLFTVRRGKYLLIEIHSNKVSFTRMTRKYGTVGYDSDLDKKTSEAFILATLVPKTPGKTALGPDMVETVKGQPLAYGWHFNEKGDEAAVVMRKTEYDIAGIRVYDGSASRIDGFETKLYRIKFSYNEDADELYYTISVDETGKHIPYLQSKFFFPALDGSGMQLLLPPGSSPWNCYTDLDFAPMYCFYTPTDSLCVIRANNTGLTIVPAYNSGTGINGALGDQLFQGKTTNSHGPVEYTQKPTSYVFKPVGITSSLFSYLGENVTAPGQSVISRYELSKSGNVVSGYGYFDPVFHQGTLFYFAAGEESIGAGSVHTQVTKGDDSYDTIALCVIPYDDASAVIAGVSRGRTGSVTGSLVYGYGNNSVWQYVETSPSAGAVTTQLWGDSRAGGVAWGLALDQKSAAADAARKKNSAKNSLERQLYVFSGDKKIKLADYAAESITNADNPLDKAPFNNLFNATAFGNPIYTFPMAVRTSYNGELIHIFCQSPVDPRKHWGVVGDWPDQLFTAAVGYA